MSPEDERLVREARERAEKASPGPWHRFPNSAQVAHYENGMEFKIATIKSWDREDENAEFLAHARQNVPALCDLAERQAAENERLRSELAETKARLKPYTDAELDYVRDL